MNYCVCLGCGRGGRREYGQREGRYRLCRGCVGDGWRIVKARNTVAFRVRVLAPKGEEEYAAVRIKRVQPPKVQ
jgi:hypothetical protein